jgi:anaerobic magnesium-protoporphyrin IX monomethyl ester cyclase
MTSRGCAWACTFCGAEATWGRGFRGHSADYTVRQIELALARLPVRMLQIKDDTFTTNRKRVLELCRKLRQKDVRFLWSCDTRVDVLGDELLREMRLAGCQRLSLGVESGSQRILDAIDKKITPDEILESTALAKKYGIRVRYYMMLGNRGETRESFHETLAFLERARPHEYIFSCLSIYPGTRDFQAAHAAGWLDARAYFDGDFQELKSPFDATPEDTALMNAWFADHSGLQQLHQPSVDECRAVMELLGEHPPALLDLAVALHDAARGLPVGDAEREARLVESEGLAARCLELGHPCPGLVHDLQACLALLRGDLEGMKERLLTAARVDPQHYALIQNVNRARTWFAARGPEQGVPLRLQPSSDFQLLERTAQPALPGPLPEDFADWGAPPRLMPASPIYLRTPNTEGSRAGLRTSLRTLR